MGEAENLKKTKMYTVLNKIFLMFAIIMLGKGIQILLFK